MENRDMSEEIVKRIKVVVEKHSDGYVAYPLGLQGVVVGQGDTYEELAPGRTLRDRIPY